MTSPSLTFVTQFLLWPPRCRLPPKVLWRTDFDKMCRVTWPKKTHLHRWTVESRDSWCTSCECGNLVSFSLFSFSSSLSLTSLYPISKQTIKHFEINPSYLIMYYEKGITLQTCLYTTAQVLTQSIMERRSNTDSKHRWRDWCLKWRVILRTSCENIIWLLASDVELYYSRQKNVRKLFKTRLLLSYLTE